MIKVQNGIATREPLPLFLLGLLPESLCDLSWTDSNLGVQDCAWWPEEYEVQPLGENERYDGEVLTLDVERKVVKSTLAIRPMTQEEIEAKEASQEYLLQPTE